MVSGLSLVVVLACVSSTGALSSGCGRALPVNVTLGKQKLHELPLLDPDSRLTEVTERKYRLYVPSSYKRDVTMPIFLYYHGNSHLFFRVC
jgi:hypothetical protein